MTTSTSTNNNTTVNNQQQQQSNNNKSNDKLEQKISECLKLYPITWTKHFLQYSIIQEQIKKHVSYIRNNCNNDITQQQQYKQEFINNIYNECNRLDQWYKETENNIIQEYYDNNNSNSLLYQLDNYILFNIDILYKLINVYDNHTKHNIYSNIQQYIDKLYISKRSHLLYTIKQYELHKQQQQQHSNISSNTMSPTDELILANSIDFTTINSNKHHQQQQSIIYNEPYSAPMLQQQPSQQQQYYQQQSKCNPNNYHNHNNTHQQLQQRSTSTMSDHTSSHTIIQSNNIISPTSSIQPLLSPSTAIFTTITSPTNNTIITPQPVQPHIAPIKQRGFSCHQCKSTKPTHMLLFCTFKTENVVDIKLSKKCRKKYCDACLRRYYNISIYDTQLQHTIHTWICPSCQDKCQCATCRRKNNNGENVQPTVVELDNRSISNNSILTHNNVLSPTAVTGIANLQILSPTNVITAANNVNVNDNNIFIQPTIRNVSSNYNQQHKRKHNDTVLQQQHTTVEPYTAPVKLQTQSRTVSLQVPNNNNNNNNTLYPDRAVSDNIPYNNNNNNQQHINNINYQQQNQYSSIQPTNILSDDILRPTKTPRNSVITTYNSQLQQPDIYDKEILSPTKFVTPKNIMVDNNKKYNNNNYVKTTTQQMNIMSIKIPGSSKLNNNNDSNDNINDMIQQRKPSLSQSNQLYANNMNIILPNNIPVIGPRDTSLAIVIDTYDNNNNKQNTTTSVDTAIQSQQRKNSIVLATPMSLATATPLLSLPPMTPLDVSFDRSILLNNHAVRNTLRLSSKDDLYTNNNNLRGSFMFPFNNNIRNSIMFNSISSPLLPQQQSQQTPNPFLNSIVNQQHNNSLVNINTPLSSIDLSSSHIVKRRNSWSNVLHNI